MLEQVLQQTLNGLSIGGGYALLALGLTLIYGILYQGNFAHCEQFVIGGYVMYVMGLAGVIYVAYIAPVVLAGFCMGWLFYRLIWRRFKEVSLTVSVLAFFGVSLILSNIMTLTFGPLSKQVPVPFGETILYLGMVKTTVQRLLAMVIAAVMAVGIWRWTVATRTGKALRAVGQNQNTAQLMGVNVNFMGMLTFALGGMLAVASALLVMPIYGVSPKVGLMMTIKGFCITVAGGLGNVPGAIIVGYILGISEALLSGLWYGPIKDVFAYVFIMLLLWIRPQGLMGRKVTGI
jgi:branched-chain amino acid transport system permease protein